MGFSHALVRTPTIGPPFGGDDSIYWQQRAGLLEAAPIVLRENSHPCPDRSALGQMGLFDDVDSMAWGKAARRRRITAFHRVCSSCFVYAASWHDPMIARQALLAAG
jgi:hypothetical protein